MQKYTRSLGRLLIACGLAFDARRSPRLGVTAISQIACVKYPLVLEDGFIYLGGPGVKLLATNSAGGVAASDWPTQDRDSRNTRSPSGVASLPVPMTPAIYIDSRR